MANRVTTIFDAVDRGVGDAVGRIQAAMRDADTGTQRLKAGWGALVTEFRNSREAQVAVAAGATALGVASVRAASDLEESANAVRVAYGLNASAVADLGDQSVESFGMSQRAFNEFAVQFSAFANQIARNGGQQVGDVVDEMATRIADFASVHNLSLEEAGRVAQSTLAGETEAFRGYGGDVSAAAVENYAFANGIADVGTKLTEGQRVLARYGLFMQRTDQYAGDFANTSGSLANQQRILAAQVENLAARFGQELAPEVTRTARAVTTLIDVLGSVGEKAGPAGDAAGWFKDRIEEAVNPVKMLETGINGLSDAFGEEEKAAGLTVEAISELSDGDKRRTTSANEARAATEEYNAQLDTQAMYAEVADAKTQALTESERREAEQLRRNAETVQRLTDEYNDQRDSIDDLIGRKNALIGGDIGVRQAQRDAKAAADELNTTLGTQGVTMDEAAAATDEAVLAQLGAAQAAADYRAKQMEANGSVVDAKVQNQLMKEELQRLAGQLDGPLRDAILRYIEQLNAIPRNVNTVVTANGTPGSIPIRPGGRYASGTRSAAAGVALVGEEGPELVELNGGERIFNARETGKIMGNQSAPSSFGGGAGGGMTLNVAPGAIVVNGNASGDDIVRALDNYVRRGGLVPADVRRRFGATA